MADGSQGAELNRFALSSSAMINSTGRTPQMDQWTPFL